MFGSSSGRSSAYRARRQEGVVHLVPKEEMPAMQQVSDQVVVHLDLASLLVAAAAQFLSR